MGILKNCYAISGDSIERAVLELYDETEAINVGGSNPGFDDVLGEPFLEDSDADGLGERFRPGVQVTVKARIEFTRYEEQVQEGVGNAPESDAVLTLYERDLLNLATPLISGGRILIRPNDRLLRIEDSSGNTRLDFEAGSRDALHVFRVDPPGTGMGVVKVFLEKRRPVR